LCKEDALLRKDDGPVPVSEDFAFYMCPDGAGEDDLFQVFALADEVAHGVLVVHVEDVLGDDGTLVELCGHVVAGGTDDFHPAVVGGVVGAGTGEGGEEGVVDVDDPVFEMADEAW